MQIDLHLCKLICINANWFAFVQIDLHLCKSISTQRTRHFLNPTHVPLQTQRLWVPFRVLNGCQLSRNIAKYCQRDLCHTWLSHCWTCHIRDLAGPVHPLALPMLLYVLADTWSVLVNTKRVVIRLAWLSHLWQCREWSYAASFAPWWKFCEYNSTPPGGMYTLKLEGR
jgi:hypothetical protein